MFRKTNKEPQLDAFTSVPSMLEGGSLRQYSDKNHWHNQFREQVLMRINESDFEVLFNDSYGAPNTSINLQVGMMILKESFGWSDSQLFEHCRFNLLTRSALGLFNINDPIPAESTYYLLRKRIYEYKKQGGEDLLEKTFKHITSEQIKEFDIDGRSIRMDSKLIGSNIAVFSRYEIIHNTLIQFYNTLDKKSIFKLSSPDKIFLAELSKEEPGKTVYQSNKEQIKERLQPIGVIIHKLLKTFTDNKTEQYKLLERVFSEQYKLVDDLLVELRPKEEITSDSVQSPDDPECAYRNKNGHKVKGYSTNITETCSDDNLNLITNIQVEKANTQDIDFVQDAIMGNTEVTKQNVNKLYLDGAYHSVDNDEFCEDNEIDLVMKGIQGTSPRYDLELTQQGLMVTDTKTGEQIQATLARKTKRSKQQKWRIHTNEGYYYFTDDAIRASMLRKKIKQLSKKELNKRNNVEATIFQLGYHLRNNKSKYRGLYKQKMWTYCRGLWINLVRIINYIKQTCQRTSNMMEMPLNFASLNDFCFFKTTSQANLMKQFSILIFINYLV
jgi:hypothetical protein